MILRRIVSGFIQKIDNAIYQIPSWQKKNERVIYERLKTHGLPNALHFDFEKIKSQILKFVKSMKVDNKVFMYKYSASTRSPNMYSSAFACMIRYLLGDIKNLNDKEKVEWIDYFNSFQSEEDGLFYDSSIRNKLFDDSDWWGARHFALLAIVALTNLGSKPKYKFKFLENYYDKKYLLKWLDKEEWDIAISHSNDIDNKIMNVVCLLQYSRDYFNDTRAGEAVKRMIEYLGSKINQNTGMWGNYNLNEPVDISRMVQFAYHLFTLFFYDNLKITNNKKIIDNVLKTQNKVGGYGVKLNSSACEDIDSIGLLIRLSSLSNYREDDIKNSLLKALPWVLSNMNEDGGFVFRRNEPFVYGHHEMSSKANESSMFATWFRTLCLAYLVNYLGIKNNFQIRKVPGYQF